MKGEISMPTPPQIEKKCPYCDLSLVVKREHFEYEGSGAIRIEYAHCPKCNASFTIRENFALIDRVIGLG